MSTRDLTIVNALGILDNPNAEQSLAAAGQLNPSSDQLSIDDRTLADAHASGLTAVNITLGYTMGEMEPYAHTLEEIAVWDRHLAEHPADLTQGPDGRRHRPSPGERQGRRHLRVPERRRRRRRRRPGRASSSGSASGSSS